MLALVTCAACRGADRTAADRPFSVRDSAGVQVVDNGGRTGRPDSLLTLTETMRISSSDDGDTTRLFFNVNVIEVDAANRIYVADASRRIRTYDSAGILLRTFGGQGKGPGEFAYIHSIMPHRDTIGVFDFSQRRLTRFDSDGHVAGEETISVGTLFDPRALVSMIALPRALVDGGLIVAMNNHKQYPGPGLKRDTITLRRLPTVSAAYAMQNGWDTATTPTRPVHSHTRWIWMEKDGTSYRWGPLWSAVPQVAFDEDGHIYTTDGMRYRITVFSADGAHVRTILRNHDPVRITGKLVDEYYAFVASVTDTMGLGPPGAPQIGREPGASNARTRTQLELERREVPHGSEMPALGRMLVARTGAIWIERPDLVDDPIRYEWDERPRPQQYWDVFDKDGRFRGTVLLPKRFSPRAVTDNAMIGVSRDEDDIESVVALSIAR